MEAVLSAATRSAGYALLRAGLLIGKEQKNEGGVTAAGGRLISQPSSPEEGLFKSGSVRRVSSSAQTGDEEWPRRGLLLCQEVLCSQLQR